MDFYVIIGFPVYSRRVVAGIQIDADRPRQHTLGRNRKIDRRNVIGVNGHWHMGWLCFICVCNDTCLVIACRKRAKFQSRIICSEVERDLVSVLIDKP
ncbi:MAG: hypothetical protein H8E17_15145 [Deltaproteobacteria bacterium]|nr:hypothetical protein [Deltaproteobacteria bacterium]